MTFQLDHPCTHLFRKCLWITPPYAGAELSTWGASQSEQRCLVALTSYVCARTHASVFGGRAGGRRADNNKYKWVNCIRCWEVVSDLRKGNGECGSGCSCPKDARVGLKRGGPVIPSGGSLGCWWTLRPLVMVCSWLLY